MRKSKFKGFLLLTLLMMLLAIPMTASAAKVTLSKSSISILKGKTYTLKVKGAKKKVTWSSSNKKIATVNSKGVVKGVKKGSCKIYAKVSGKKYTCKVTVKQPVTKIKLNKTSISLKKGKTYTLKATASPSNANTKTVTWSSSNKYVATVNSKGKVTAVGAGTATITAKAKDGSGKKATCKVVVDNSKCTHKKTYVVNKVEANCEWEGYTGDICCWDCGRILSYGKKVLKTGHKNTYISNEKEATYFDEGYTGDTYCSDCYTKISEGKIIPKRTDYIVVNLTKDNWSTYFELVDIPNFRFNGFGELEEVCVYQSLALKPQYSTKIITNLCEGVVEYKGNEANCKCVLDVQNRKCRVEKNVQASYKESDISDMDWSVRIDEKGNYHYWYDQNVVEKEIPSFCFSLGYVFYTEEPNIISHYITDFNVLRIQGKLYFEK